MSEIWNNNHKFIAIEGLDGSGKSSLCKVYTSMLRNDNVGVFLFAPSEVIKNPNFDNELPLDLEYLDKLSISKNKVLDCINKLKHPVNQTVEVYNELGKEYLNFMSVYSEVLYKHISNGYKVIADRWDMSTLAYNRGNNGDILDYYNNMSNYILKPDAYVFLDIDSHTCYERINKRDNGIIDKAFETEDRLIRTYDAYKHYINTLDRYKNSVIEIPDTPNVTHAVMLTIGKLCNSKKGD